MDTHQVTGGIKHTAGAIEEGFGRMTGRPFHRGFWRRSQGRRSDRGCVRRRGRRDARDGRAQPAARARDHRDRRLRAWRTGHRSRRTQGLKTPFRRRFRKDTDHEDQDARSCPRRRCGNGTVRVQHRQWRGQGHQIGRHRRFRRIGPKRQEALIASIDRVNEGPGAHRRTGAFSFSAQRALALPNLSARRWPTSRPRSSRTHSAT